MVGGIVFKLITFTNCMDILKVKKHLSVKTNFFLKQRTAVTRIQESIFEKC